MKSSVIFFFGRFASWHHRSDARIAWDVWSQMSSPPPNHHHHPFSVVSWSIFHFFIKIMPWEAARINIVELWHWAHVYPRLKSVLEMSTPRTDHLGTWGSHQWLNPWCTVLCICILLCVHFHLRAWLHYLSYGWAWRSVYKYHTNK